MSSFNNFITDCLSDETIEEILSAAMAKGNQASLQVSGTDRSEIVGRQILAVSFTVSVELLRRYHQWLAEGT